MSYWNHNLMIQITDRQQEAVNKIETNGDKMAAMWQKFVALWKQKQALQQDQSGARPARMASRTWSQPKCESRDHVCYNSRYGPVIIWEPGRTFTYKKNTSLAEYLRKYKAGIIVIWLRKKIQML